MIFTVDLATFGYGARELIFLARKAVGYLFRAPITAASLLLGVRRAGIPDAHGNGEYRLLPPSIGPRQHSVDIGVVGFDDDGVRKVFLFSVETGNLTRRDWNVGQQALKPSLDEILHVYLRSGSRSPTPISPS